MSMITPPLFDHKKRYLPLSQHYRKLFHSKVFKLSVSTAQTCPNRSGVNGMKVCVFCDEWGSAAYNQTAESSLKHQIAIHREAIRKRYKAEKFLVYFQSYTNTFGRIRELETLYLEALKERDVVGIVAGTRPDCLPSRVLKLFDELSQDHYVSVELGLQTFDDDQLKFLSRGHNKDCSLKALKKLESLSNVEVCVHLMFGLPGETDTQLIETAQMLSNLGVHGVKLHNLHVLKNTPLERLYRNGKFKPVELEEYARKVCLFLENLSPSIAVHRLAAVASRWDELVSPLWTKEKMRPSQFIEDYLEAKDTWQGKLNRSA